MKTLHLRLLKVFQFHYDSITSSSLLCSSEVSKNFLLQNRLNSSYCTPPISDNVSKKIDSVVGLQIGLNHVSWAKIETKTNFLSHLDFLNLPSGINKMQELHQIYSVADEIINNLPSADCYTMDNIPKIVSNSSGKLRLTLQVTRMQLVSMLVALLNSNSDRCQPVILMKPHVVARLFNLLVGSEIIAVHDTVNKLLTKPDFKPFTPVNCCPNVLKYYNEVQNEKKEFLGRAFLTAVTFTELMCIKNQECYKILCSNSQKKSIA